MALLAVGVLLLLAKLFGLAPFADWSWWVVGAPFAGAAAWWTFVDMSGITARRVAAKMEDRQEQRRIKAMEALGLNTASRRRRAGAAARRPEPPRPPVAEASSPSRPEPDPPPPRRDPRI
jgi:small Trp-rich protein